MESQNSFEIVKLVYPNKWKKNVTLVNSDVEKCQPGWFLYSQRIYDKDKKLYYIIVSPSSQFYNENTGETFVFKNDEDELSSKPKLIIANDSCNKSIISLKENNYSLDDTVKIFNKSLELGYDGIVLNNNSSSKGKSNSCTDTKELCCQDFTFVIKKDVLKTNKISERCHLIKHMKRNNSKIRKSIPDFPTCSEIDQLLEDNRCSDVNVILSDILKKHEK